MLGLADGPTTMGGNGVQLNRRILAVGSVLAGVIALAAIAVGTSSARPAADDLSGAGATFPFPLISQWIPAYERAKGVKVSYNPVGSGAGIQAITNRSVDFGASDAPLTPDQFRACRGCVQIPWVLSATAVMYKLDGLRNNLRVTGPVIADMYLGRITRWNDRRLRALNPGVNLPNEAITPIFRSDSSGTTYNFTDYLSTVSRQFKNRVGNGTQVNFPVGVGGRGSSGVSGVLSRTNGGIAYADIAYALKNKLQFFKVKNKAGKFVTPGIRAIRAAASTIKKVPRNNAMHITDPPKVKSLAYPICTFSYVLLPLKSSKAVALRQFVAWAMTTGQTFGPRLLFVPIPKVVRTASMKTLRRVKT
jgi:phosphate transport system substrate-binding protein